MFAIAPSRTLALRQAIEQGQLELFCQPMATIATGRLVGVEALVRWRHQQYPATSHRRGSDDRQIHPAPLFGGKIGGVDHFHHVSAEASVRN
ncbi:MAG: EAL domain-containing protein [Chloroflexota bacterium]|nr:EAL domain-containing protein [Chloroflexota bacterium]